MPSIHHAAPQLLVDDLTKSLDFYQRQLGFTIDFTYEGFYASVSRDGATLHLKCAPKMAADRTHRTENDHIDVYLETAGVRDLHDEVAGRGAPIRQPLIEQAWHNLDFQVTDPDGYILCFSEPLG